MWKKVVVRFSVLFSFPLPILYFCFSPKWSQILEKKLQKSERKKRKNTNTLVELDKGNASMKNSSPMPSRYWTNKKNRNMRSLLETFAKKSGFDFLVPSNWYKCKREDFYKLKVLVFFPFLVLVWTFCDFLKLGFEWTTIYLFLFFCGSFWFWSLFLFFWVLGLVFGF